MQEEVLRRIRTLEWAPGNQIPNETDLAREFGCARATVNRALQSLAEAGLLERRRRAGTRVAALPVRHAKLRIPILRQEIEANGQAYGYRLLECETTPASERAEQLFGKAKLLHVLALHFANDEPYVHEDRWINIDAIPTATEVDFSKISANEWLVTNAPISTGEIAFEADAADHTEASIFGCKLGAALFRAERTTWHDGAPVTFVRQTFLPGHRLVMRI